MLEVKDCSLEVGVRTLLLNHISFKVAKGGIACLLGNNGAGKSTLLRAIAGLHPLFAGRVFMDGQDYTHATEEERFLHLSWSPQSQDRVEGCSVGKYVSMAHECQRFTDKRWKSTAAEHAQCENAMALFDVLALVERSTHVLSGGEWKRVQLARVWAQNAPVILLDEPTAGLDMMHIAALIKRIREAQNLGKTFLLSTHDLEFASKIAQQFICLHSGTVTCIADVGELEKQKVLEEIFEVPFVWVDINKARVPISGY